VIQQNSASAEQMAATAEELTEQSQQLNDIMAYFRLEQREDVSSAAEASAAESIPAAKQKSPQLQLPE
jgi:methyl-accepting chemotaxis protein